VLTIRELRALAVRLDPEAFAKQVGPFVLVERPYQKEQAPIAAVPKTTRRLTAPDPSARAPGFDELWVGTLPPMKDEDEMLVGRTADCDVVLDEGTVSKHHAHIRWKKTYAELEDLGSSNGTFLNGSFVPVKTWLRLKNEDAVDFGAVRVLFLEVASLRARLGL
jgi:hypothetical protein